MKNITKHIRNLHLPLLMMVSAWFAVCPTVCAVDVYAGQGSSAAQMSQHHPDLPQYMPEMAPVQAGHAHISGAASHQQSSEPCVDHSRGDSRLSLLAGLKSLGTVLDIEVSGVFYHALDPLVRVLSHRDRPVAIPSQLSSVRLLI